MTDRFVRGTPRPPEQLVLDTEILVLGGGLPGVCAAIAAAEAGCTVTLVEKSLTLGGNCGPEIGVHPSDAHRFHTYMVSTGTVGRLIEDAAFHQAKTVSDDEHYNISMRWDSVMREALDRAGVRVLLSHYAHTPYIEENRITAVVCEDTLTYQQVLIRISHFVIDDTGDGNVAERAGANYRMGRESRQEHGERLAPEEADSQTMGASLVALIQKTEKDRVFLPPKDTPPFYPGYGGDLNWRIPDSWYPHFFFPTETGGDLDIIRDGQEVYRRLRGHLDSAWNRLRNDVNGDNGRNWEMVWVSQKVAKRESRRFEGDYWLTETDVETGRQFDDAIGVGGFAMDIHDPKPENPEYVKITYYLIPPVYTIPYRCTYSKTVENLFFASRLLSATHLAHGTVRLQRTLAALAQAVGTAA
ncbi:MAG: FAD-dependent oxidoreductase, partial [Clostridia bacterium]|nr:FAD-dependent oxidoreductase [Clostridia bacterium]